MKLTYSKPVIPRVGSSRTYSRVFKGDVLGRSIQIYRMWFFFLRLGLDCEDNNVDIIDHVNKKNICNGGICEDKKVLEDDYRIIDTINKTYTIRKNVYKLENISSSGFFTIFKVGSAAYMKMHWMKKDFLMNLERGEFMEVLDNELTSEISWGICKF